MELFIQTKDWDEYMNSNGYWSFRQTRNGPKRKSFLRKFVDILAQRLQTIGFFK